MPHPGTHITVVQRLVLANPQFAKVMGSADPNVPLGSKQAAIDAVRLSRFTNLGAVGPDVFYFMADFMNFLQNFQPLENFIVKLAGTVEAIGDVGKEFDKAMAKVESEVEAVVPCSKAVIDTVHGLTGEAIGTAKLVATTFTTFFEVIPIYGGLNVWGALEPPRQTDETRSKWFWADYLHYAHSGKFAQQLLTKSRFDAKYKDHPALFAYSLGYLTHHITDVVGHPYVNQIVRAPYRLYWQRHALVENFIDAQVWDRWHTNLGKADPSGEIDPITQEAWLDRPSAKPNALGTGAPFVFARLNDLINCGGVGLDDPVNKFITDAAEKIKKGIDLVAGLDDIELTDDDEFKLWTQFMAETIKEVYPPGVAHPANLPGNGGYPSADDINGAYGTCRFFLKMMTEQTVEEPEMPNITADISDGLQQLWDDLEKDLSSLPSPPSISTGSGFSFDKLWSGIKAWANWVKDAAKALIKAASDFINNVCDIGGTFVRDLVKMAMYFIKRALWAMYQAFREVLVKAAYAQPGTDDLKTFSSLWTSPGNLTAVYPVEELCLADGTRPEAMIWGDYTPLTAPDSVAGTVQELAAVGWTAPYSTGATPDNLMDRPLVAAKAGDTLINDMFSPQAPPPSPGAVTNTPQGPLQDPVTFSSLASGQTLISFTDRHYDYGGAIPNCKRAIAAILAAPSGQLFPIDAKTKKPTMMVNDFNLDGDRGYGWPCWDVARDANDAPKNAAGSLLSPTSYPAKTPLTAVHQAIAMARPWKD
jgi:hypothetical protein